MPGTVQAVADVKPRTKSEKTRLRILDAAAKTFRDKGYSATRLADIAAAADTQAGSLYYHFESKDQLLAEVLDRGIVRVAEFVRHRVDALGSSASHRERLRVAILAQLEINLEHDDYVAANIHLNDQIPEPIREAQIRKHRIYAAYWQGLLKSAQDAGEIRPEVDISLARLNLFGMMNWSFEWYRPGRLDIETIAGTMCETLFDGIGTHSP